MGRGQRETERKMKGSEGYPKLQVAAYLGELKENLWGLSTSETTTRPELYLQVGLSMVEVIHLLPWSVPLVSLWFPSACV